MEAEKTLYAYDIPLKDIALYVEPIKRHFGLYHPNIEPEIALLERDPERTYEIIEYVTYTRLDELLDKYFPKMTGQTRDEIESLLWLVGNLYYGNSFKAFQEYYDDVAQEDLIWDSIKSELLDLYAFMQDHKDSEEFTIKFGKGAKNSITLPNNFHWFQRLMGNQLFPNTIPEVTDKKQAKALLRRQSGRHEERKEVNAIVCGLSSLFAESGEIEGTAPKALLDFTHDFLIEMALIKPDDTYVTQNWIKAQISNFQKSGKDRRFFSPGFESCTIEEMSTISLRNKGLDWLFK